MKQMTFAVLACLFFSLTVAHADTLRADTISVVNRKELPRLKFNGFLRFNYNYSNWKEGSKKRWGDFQTRSERFLEKDIAGCRLPFLCKGFRWCHA